MSWLANITASIVLANILVTFLPVIGIVVAICTRFSAAGKWAIPAYRGVLALLCGVILGAAGQSPQIWCLCLLTFSVMLLIGITDFSRHFHRRSV
jgi:hypothetical protein